MNYNNKKRDHNYLIILGYSLILILLIISNQTIFGSKIDWLAQHVAFPDYFRNLFYKTHNLLPSFAFSLGAGQNIYNFSYYGLYNPLILISYLFPFIKMSAYITFMNVFIYIIFGFLTYYFFKRRISKKFSLITTILIISAAPILFHFHRHFMFVDYLPFLILGMIGVDKYIEDNKMSLIAISLLFIITISYYYSIPCILVLCIYAVYKYLEYNKKIDFTKMFKKGVFFLIPVIIGILSSCLLLLPTYNTIISGRESNVKKTITLLEKITPIFNVEALLYSNYTMGLTALSLIAVVYGILSKKKEHKFLSITLAIILNVPIFIYILNGNLYFRNKVLIPFIPLIGLLIINFLEKLFQKKIKFKQMLLLSLLLIYLTIIQTTKNASIGFSLILTLDILIVLSVIYLYQNKKVSEKILIIFILVPSVLNVLVANYNDEYVDENLISEVEDIKISEEIGKVLKKEKDIVRSNNLDNTVYNLNRIYSERFNQNSVYSSVSNKEYQKFYQKVFREALPYRNKLMLPQNNDILFQTFMGVKYIYTKGKVPIGYTKVSENIYKNDNVMPVLYGTSNIISDSDFKNLEYPNNISALLSGAVVKNEKSNISTDIAIKPYDLDYELVKTKNINVETKDNKTIIKSRDNGKIKLKVNNLKKDDILIINIKLLNKQECFNGKTDQRITINGISNVLTCKNSFYQNNNKTFHYVLSDNNGIDELEMIFNKGIYKIGEFETYKLNYKDLSKIKDKQSTFIPDTNDIGNTISGSIDMQSDGYFVTSIPYDDGFSIKVDNKQVDAIKLNKAFLGFKLDKGKHNIKIIYQAPLQKEGLIISIIGLIGILVLIIHDVKIDKKNKIEK